MQSNPKSSKRTINIIVGVIGVLVICCICFIAAALINRNPVASAPSVIPTTVPIETMIAGTVSAASQQTAAAGQNLSPTEIIISPTIEPTRPEPTNTLLPPTATQDPNLIMPGTYMMGIDIQPGIYRGEAGADIMNSCYWAKLKDLSGNLDALISNENSIGQFYVEVENSDFAFETRCALVPLSSLPIGEPSQTITAGMYIVGRDIQAGTYKGQAGADIMSSCYWGRLSNVTGKQSALIANDNSIGQFYIQVDASDFALVTKCNLERVGD